MSRHSALSQIMHCLAVVLIVVLAACGSQKEDRNDLAFHRFHQPLDQLLAKSEKMDWEAANRALELTLDDRQRLLVELNYRAARLPGLTERLREQGIAIKRINHNDERMTVWVSTASELWSLAQIDGIYLVAEARDTLPQTVIYETSSVINP